MLLYRQLFAVFTHSTLPIVFFAVCCMVFDAYT
jgi:hypothetical protein